MFRLSLYHRFLVGICIIWTSLFAAGVLIVMHVQSLHEEDLRVYWAHTTLSARISDYQQSLAQLELAQGERGPEREDRLRAAGGRLQSSTHELEISLQDLGPVPEGSSSTRALLKGANQFLAELHTRGAEDTARTGKLRDRIAALMWQARDVHLEYRKFLRQYRAEVPVKMRDSWAAFAGMALGSLVLAWLIALYLARKTIHPIFKLARRTNDRLDDEHQVELNATHPVDSLRYAVNALFDEFHEVRQEFESSRGRVEKSERLAVAGRVAVGLVHELQKPLEAIRVTLASGADSSDICPGDFQERMNDIGLVEELLEEFLEFTGAQKPRFTLLNINDVVEDALQFVAGECEQRKIKVEKELGDFPHVLADEALLQDALINIFHNSLEAMSSGGQLTVTTRLSLSGGGLSLSQSQGVELFVADMGPGFPEDPGKSFDPFFSTKPKGTGMGLTIVKRVVEQHGGAVRLLERDGGGAIVSIFLPLPSAEQHAAIARMEDALVPKPEDADSQ